MVIRAQANGKKWAKYMEKHRLLLNIWKHIHPTYKTNAN
jgi:hypothetical protein